MSKNAPKEKLGEDSGEKQALCFFPRFSMEQPDFGRDSSCPLQGQPKDPPTQGHQYFHKV